MFNWKDRFTHSDDEDFESKMRGLLLYRKIVKVEECDDQTAKLILDNGVEIITIGNDGCGGCANGWYFVDGLNECDNIITNVECVVEDDHYEDVYKIFVFTINDKIKALQYRGSDNGFYGTGFEVHVRIPKEES